MYIGIDISGDALRFDGIFDEQKICVNEYGVTGIPPRKSETFVWNRRRTVRWSRPTETFSMAEAWQGFLNKTGATFHWQYENGSTGQIQMINMVAEAISQNLPESKATKTVVAIDNYLSENHQENLLNALRSEGMADRELLWRPVALTLAFLEQQGVEQFNEGDLLLIVDVESQRPEVTILELREHRGMLVPLRRLAKSTDRLDLDYNIYELRRELALEAAGLDENVAKQLCKGPFANEFIAFTENLPYEDIWFQKDGRYLPVQLNNALLEDVANLAVNSCSMSDIRRTVSDKHDLTEMAAVLWHGWPVRMNEEMLEWDNEYVMDANAACRGASLYALKLLENIPTYLDTLPGLEILSEVQRGDMRVPEFCGLIEQGFIEGGGSKVIQEPIRHFSLKKVDTQFKAVLRTIDDRKCKRLVTDLPSVMRLGETPLLLRAEMRPAHGYALVTIEGAEGHEDVFGKIRRIKLDWSSMKDIEPDLYNRPEVYPVRGRVFDDPECFAALGEVVNNNGPMSYRVNFCNHLVAFNKVFEPWGYNTPWGTTLREPTRGLFGAMHVVNDEINELAEVLAEIIDNESENYRHKYFNYMFRYTSESFLDELRIIYRSDQPNISSWNTAFAPGRVFYQAEDFELFLDFILRVSEGHGWPSYPDESYTKCYWWSFFRCLCYYDDTVNVPRHKVENVLVCLHNYVSERSEENWSARPGETGRWARSSIENVKKFCLCAILFSLRLRNVHYDFLEPGSELCSTLDDALNLMGNVQYPRTMLATQQSDCLNDYVRRFLFSEASEADFEALTSLTTLIA